MKASLVLVVFFALTFFVKAQQNLDWDGSYQLQLSDFQASSTQIGSSKIYSIHSGSSFDFAFHMTNAEFMFTKNFNQKVSCSFNRSAASIVAPDSVIAADLLNFARYEFDLAELYARKLRQRLNEAKGTFSDISFSKPVYEQVHKEFNVRHANAGRATDLGRNAQALAALHLDVREELALLADFCKTCKPIKKKK
jgi:hypothetical protein